MPYLNLLTWLIILGLIYLKVPQYRLPVSVVMGISYFLWGMFIHKRDKTLFLPVVLEYLAISLLGAIVLIFISLRA
ncbi:MAG: hypothetical protein NTZ93_02905 [Candidatus Beckwithbacteria bacterium]|nr:hypothetical protein [Candidatus Beckwithbacteria bacterium]